MCEDRAVDGSGSADRRQIRWRVGASGNGVVVTPTVVLIRPDADCSAARSSRGERSFSAPRYR